MLEDEDEFSRTKEEKKYLERGFRDFLVKERRNKGVTRAGWQKGDRGERKKEKKNIVVEVTTRDSKQEQVAKEVKVTTRDSKQEQIKSEKEGGDNWEKPRKRRNRRSYRALDKVETLMLIINWINYIIIIQEQMQMIPGLRGQLEDNSTWCTGGATLMPDVLTPSCKDGKCVNY